MLQRWIDRIEAINIYTGLAVSWLTLLMVLSTFLIVVLRYLFDFGLIAMQESVIYMHALIFLLGAAFTLQKDAHVRVDIFYQRLSARAQAKINLFGHIVFLAPSMLFIFIISWQYVSESWQVMETSREAGGLPGVFLLKTMILLMAALMLLQAIAGSLRAIQTLQQNHSEHQR
ncbi:MAG: TRAP transporter small permease subunit [Gammaproteobacteria bacterium]|nr:TRAP transporter small permease subunit [Gammaproteobacteria bacterium]